MTIWAKNVKKGHSQTGTNIERYFGGGFCDPWVDPNKTGATKTWFFHGRSWLTDVTSQTIREREGVGFVSHSDRHRQDAHAHTHTDRHGGHMARWS